MSVYTAVSPCDMAKALQQFNLGELLDLQGIQGGITNTNYFLTTLSSPLAAPQRFVLTLFETISLPEVQAYLALMQHVASKGFTAPAPIAQTNGQLAFMLSGKPACLVSCLSGKEVEIPNLKQAASAGATLAQFHLAAADFARPLPDERSRTWRQKTGDFLIQNHVLPTHLAANLAQELADDAAFDDSGLPQGVIHADYFKDNVLMQGDATSGVIDFYYACYGSLIYDVAVAVNDFARLANGQIDTELSHAFLTAYQSVRPYTPAEHQAWPQILRLAALRFWLSRLQDFYYPNAGEMTFIKPPAAFETLIVNYRAGHFPPLP